MISDNVNELSPEQLNPDVLDLLELLEQQLLPGTDAEQAMSELQLTLLDEHVTRVYSEQAYLSFLNMLLSACIQQIPVNSPLHDQLTQLQDTLTPPLSIAEIEVIDHTIQQVSDQLRRAGILSVEQVSLILNPILMEFSAAEQQAGSALQQTTQSKHESTVYEERGPNTTRPRQETLASKKRRNLRESHGIGFDILDAMSFGAEASSYRNEVQALQQNFIQQLRIAVNQITSFGEQLETEIRYMEDVGPIGDVDAYQQSVLATLQSLRSGHAALAENFDSARTYLSVIESGSQQLMDELDRVRLLSLTDELTSLPNRRAFLRRISTEVSRVKRYRHPLTLVMVDLDHFKRINDRFGHSVGDTVLRAYADNVFTLFRQHDLVARYGGEEFVILFPDTDINGVLLALHKIQAKARRIKIKVPDGTIQLPGFSAGIAEYQQGEAPAAFIDRADKALYRAKHLGRGRFEMAEQMQAQAAEGIESGE